MPHNYETPFMQEQPARGRRATTFSLPNTSGGWWAACAPFGDLSSVEHDELAEAVSRDTSADVLCTRIDELLGPAAKCLFAVGNGAAEPRFVITTYSSNSTLTLGSSYSNEIMISLPWSHEGAPIRRLGMILACLIALRAQDVSDVPECSQEGTRYERARAWWANESNSARAIKAGCLIAQSRAIEAARRDLDEALASLLRAERGGGPGYNSHEHMMHAQSIARDLGAGPWDEPEPALPRCAHAQRKPGEPVRGLWEVRLRHPGSSAFFETLVAASAALAEDCGDLLGPDGVHETQRCAECERDERTLALIADGPLPGAE